MPRTTKKETKEETKSEGGNEELMKILSSIADGQQALQEGFADLSDRVHTIETKGADEFKKGANPDDIEAAASTREGVDPKISSIVDEILGSDFGVRITSDDERPGFLFTILVPERLSPVERSERPVLGEDGKYEKDEYGASVMEQYFPEDRRSRVISSTASYDAIREHCNRIRANIVGYYQKMKQPIPEFKLK